MAIRYTLEELLHLRDSPLCVKPKDLPPLEDWMGQVIDDKAKRQPSGRAVREGQASGITTTTKLPLALEFSRPHGRQASNGDFAVKSGMFSPGIKDSSKTYETSSRMASGPLSPRGEQPIGMGRFGAGDRDQGATRERATTRFSALRASKDEGDSWLTGKTTRKQENDDVDRPFGRRVDREKDSGRDNGRDNHRRYGSDAVTDNIRNRDWRNNDRGGARPTGRDWNNGQEQDPEWMAEEKPPAEEKKRTVEDFEAWKRSMRAQDAAAKGESLPSTEDQILQNQPAPKKMIETPLALEAGEDKFFGLWGAPKDTTTAQNIGQTNQQPAAPKLGGKSKFTNFFAVPEPQSQPPQQQQHQPPPPPPPQQPQPPQPHPQPSQAQQQIPHIEERYAPTPPQSGAGHKPPAFEDEQGFQRILNMLKAKSPAAPPFNPAFQAPPQNNTPPREATSLSATPPLVSPRPKSHGVQNFLNPQSPGTDPNSQFLLNLMRAKDPEPASTMLPQYNSPLGQPQSYGAPPPYSTQYDRNPDQRIPDLPPGFDKLNPSAHQLNTSAHQLNQRRHGRFDSRSFDDAQSQHQQQHGPPPGFPGFQPGLNAPNFPPGLGPMPGQQRGFHGPRGPVGAPPGFGGPSGPGLGGPGAGPGPFRGGMDYPPGFGGMPNIGSMHIGGDQGPLGPPPGFNGPPGPGRPPPGFVDRGGPLNMPMGDIFDGRRGEQGLYGSRE